MVSHDQQIDAWKRCIFYLEKSSVLFQTALFKKGAVCLYLCQRQGRGGSSPTSRGKQAVGIYGIFGEILRRKIPETVDAVGVAPTASIVFG